MNENSFVYKYKSILVFLIIEVLALLSFSFGNINEVFLLLGSVLCLFAFAFSFLSNVDKNSFKKLIWPCALLFIVSGLAAFGGFASSFSLFSNVAVFFALPSFFALGFFTRRLGEVKIEYILLAIGFGFALITLISTIGTWIQYGLFYSLIYKVKGTTSYYYNGVPYDVTEEMSFLVGFSFAEVSLEYGGLFGIMCGSFLPALLFVKKEENRNMFIASAVIGGIGLISLITIPNFKALIILIIASLFAVLYKYLKNHKKVTSALGYTFVGIVGLGVLFFVIAIVNAAIGFRFSGFLNRVFVQNGLMIGPSRVLEAAFKRTDDGKFLNLFGFVIDDPVYSLVWGMRSIVFENTGIFEIQIIKEVGIIGALLFVGFICAMIYFVIRYIKSENDQDYIKNIVVVALIAFFAYSSICNDIIPTTHLGEYSAFFRSSTLAIALFLLGFVYCAPKEVKFNLIKNEEEKTNE